MPRRDHGCLACVCVCFLRGGLARGVACLCACGCQSFGRRRSSIRAPNSSARGLRAQIDSIDDERERAKAPTADPQADPPPATHTAHGRVSVLEWNDDALNRSIHLAFQSINYSIIDDGTRSQIDPDDLALFDVECSTPHRLSTSERATTEEEKWMTQSKTLTYPSPDRSFPPKPTHSAPASRLRPHSRSARQGLIQAGRTVREQEQQQQPAAPQPLTATTLRRRRPLVVL